MGTRNCPICGQEVPFPYGICSKGHTLSMGVTCYKCNHQLGDSGEMDGLYCPHCRAPFDLRYPGQGKEIVNPPEKTKSSESVRRFKRRIPGLPMRTK